MQNQQTSMESKYDKTYKKYALKLKRRNFHSTQISTTAHPLWPHNAAMYQILAKPIHRWIIPILILFRSIFIGLYVCQ